MSAPKLTPWFDGALDPWEPGVYEVLDLDCPGHTRAYSLFDGFWHTNRFDKTVAETETVKTGMRQFKWRGLAKNPALASTKGAA